MATSNQKELGEFINHHTLPVLNIQPWLELYKEDKKPYGISWVQNQDKYLHEPQTEHRAKALRRGQWLALGSLLAAAARLRLL